VWTQAAWTQELKLHEELFTQLAYHLPAEMPATKAKIEAAPGSLIEKSDFPIGICDGPSGPSFFFGIFSFVPPHSGGDEQVWDTL
jgi:hypothetical protein